MIVRDLIEQLRKLPHYLDEGTGEKQLCILDNLLVMTPRQLQALSKIVAPWRPTESSYSPSDLDLIHRTLV